jgi:hypothetical protein
MSKIARSPKPRCGTDDGIEHLAMWATLPEALAIHVVEDLAKI